MKRDQRWTWLLLLLGVNGFSLAIMWTVQLVVEVDITPRNFLNISLWDILSQVSSFTELGEILQSFFHAILFGEGLEPHQRIQWIAFPLAAVCFAVLIGTSLYRLRPWRAHFHWRLRTAMLLIALLAVEYSLAVSAWHLKDKWNKCFIMAVYWANRGYELTPRSGKEVREWDEFRSEKEDKYKHFLWNPWELAFVTWDEIKWKPSDRQNAFIDPQSPIR